VREHIELVYRAFTDEDGAPLADTIEEFAKAPAEIHDALYAEWERFQGEAAATPLNQKQLDELIEGLKKKAPSEVLDVLPSIWLRQLLHTLVSPPPTLTTESEPG
jgi:hypothetical protein